MTRPGKSFDRAQAAHDAQSAPDDHNCKEDGHVWRKHRVARIGGEDITEYKCIVLGCGLTTIDLGARG